MKYAKSGNTLVCRMDNGEDFIHELKLLMQAEGILSALVVSCIGMLEKPVIGWFDGKEYQKKELEGDPYEVISLQGNISLKGEAEPYIHIHAALAGKDHSSLGGHLFAGKVFNVIEIGLIITTGITMFRQQLTEGGPLLLFPESRRG